MCVCDADREVAAAVLAVISMVFSGLYLIGTLVHACGSVSHFSAAGRLFFITITFTTAVAAWGLMHSVHRPDQDDSNKDFGWSSIVFAVGAFLHVVPWIMEVMVAHTHCTEGITSEYKEIWMGNSYTGLN